MTDVVLKLTSVSHWFSNKPGDNEIIWNNWHTWRWYHLPIFTSPLRVGRKWRQEGRRRGKGKKERGAAANVAMSEIRASSISTQVIVHTNPSRDISSNHCRSACGGMRYLPLNQTCCSWGRWWILNDQRVTELVVVLIQHLGSGLLSRLLGVFYSWGKRSCLVKRPCNWSCTETQAKALPVWPQDTDPCQTLGECRQMQT